MNRKSYSILIVFFEPEPELNRNWTGTEPLKIKFATFEPELNLKNKICWTRTGTELLKISVPNLTWTGTFL